jgi:hypothetical protein
MPTRLLVLLYLLGIVFCHSDAIAATAADADYACREAAGETLKSNTPAHFKAMVIANCVKALRDKNSKTACDRVAKSLGSSDRFAVAYTCETARSILE